MTDRLATWKVWWASAAVFVVFAGVFFASSAPFAVSHVEALCGEAPLDVRFTSSAADVERFLEACGPAGRDAYRNMQVADLFAWAALAAFPEPAATNSLLGVASAAKTTLFWFAGALVLLTAGAIVARGVRRRITRRAVPAAGLG